MAEHNYRQHAALDFQSMRIAQATDGKFAQDYLKELIGDD